MLQLTRKGISGFLSLVLLLALVIPAQAGGHRFGLDDDMTKKVADQANISQLPLQKVWQVPLGGDVHSQPIIVDSMKAIFVQAGKDFLRLDYDQASFQKPPKITRIQNVNNHEWPSASAPTYAQTNYGQRIYQATRNHRIYAIDPISMTIEWGGVLTAGGKPDQRYRITTSPMVRNVGSKTYITLGTAHGDLTGLPGQYADDGFFVIEDKGNSPQMIFQKRMVGEVTGSHLTAAGNVVITENTLNAKSRLMQYSIQKNDLLKETEIELNAGVPTSPAHENGYLYIADRNGFLYKVAADTMKTIWVNTDASPNSRVLEDPTIGDKYIFMPVRHYRNDGGSGAVLAINKWNGQTAKVIPLTSPLKNHTLYWKPDKSKPGYVVIFESNGKIRFVQEDTWQNAPWLKDDKGQLQSEPQLIQTSDQYTSSQLVFHDSLLLLVDGNGVMHAYRANRPVDLAVTSLISAGKDLSGIKQGEKVTLKATVTNTSDLDFTAVPVALATSEKVIETQTVDLPHGSMKEITFSTDMPQTLPYFAVTINPSKDKPANEITYDNNTKVIAKPIDLRIDKLDYPKRWNPSDGVFTVTAHTFVNPMDTGLTDPINTEIELEVSGKTVKKPVVVTPNRDEQFTVAIDLSDIDFTDQTYLTGRATINPGFPIYEREEDRDNNTKPIDNVYIVQPYDLVAESIAASKNPANAGANVTITARVKNDSIEAQNNVLVVVTHEDKEIYRSRLDFAVGETKSISFNWIAPNQASADLTLIVDPNEEAKDYNRKNNTKSMLLKIIPNWAEPTCATDKPNGSWSVTYWYIYGYDKDGNPKWRSKRVTYFESLSSEVKVNTKQGIPTDPKNSKPTDHESRGSYAIIPYAAKNGLNPNEVTRAGYGIEVNVTTKYQNDWETKVPQGYEDTAVPFGGEFKGPTEVEALFYDPKGKLVSRQKLEKTSGNGYTDVWQLPKASHKLLTGETIVDRKHYVDVKTIDGKYTVQVLAKFAGHEGLSVCDQKTITIYGNMWEDIQNIRQSN